MEYNVFDRRFLVFLFPSKFQTHDLQVFIKPSFIIRSFTNTTEPFEGCGASSSTTSSTSSSPIHHSRLRRDSSGSSKSSAPSTPLQPALKHTSNLPKDLQATCSPRNQRSMSLGGSVHEQLLAMHQRSQSPPQTVELSRADNG